MKNRHGLTHWAATVSATCGYLGYAPVAPGTLASATTCIIWYVAPPLAWPCSIGILMSIFVLGVLSSNRIVTLSSEHDPSYIVIDEVVGMGLALYGLPNNGKYILLAFVLFRAFDIIKPFPISWIEKNIPKGWGIMLDDVAAGIAARMVIYGLLSLSL